MFFFFLGERIIFGFHIILNRVYKHFSIKHIAIFQSNFFFFFEWIYKKYRPNIQYVLQTIKNHNKNFDIKKSLKYCLLIEITLIP